MREWRWLWGACAGIFLLTAAGMRAQCVPTARTITTIGNVPSLVAGPIATSGTVLGLAKSDITTGTPAVFFATFNSSLNPLTPDRQIADSSANGAVALVSNGSEFALFYQAQNLTMMMQRIDAIGNPIGAVIPIANHIWNAGDEFDVAYSPARNVYGIARTVTLGSDRGLYVTIISTTGTVISDTLVSFFFSPPASPRLTPLPDGSFAMVWKRTGSDSQSLVFSIVAPSGSLKSNTVSERNVSDARIASDGSTILIIYSSAVTGGTELRYAQFDLSASTTTADSPFITGTGSDILPLQLQWNPALSEWTLTYIDAAFGFSTFTETRLRRFPSPTTGTPSDTLLSPDPVHSRLTAPYPLVFLNGGYIGSIQTITSRSLGSESYLVKLCPFFVTAAANPAVNHGFTPITFTANPSGGTPAYTFNWEFGDNDSGQGQVVQHIYRTPGTYVATLTARDAAGATVILKVPVQIIATTPGRQRAVKH